MRANHCAFIVPLLLMWIGSAVGKCRPDGKECNLYSTCLGCCGVVYYWQSDQNHYCGCITNGRKCVPAMNCDQCCNGAFAANGYQCGGTCHPDGTECQSGTNCHLCCNSPSYWYRKGQTSCGNEPCYPDGTRCGPNENCDTNCCNGGFYWDHKIAASRCGTKKCLANGTSCVPSFDCEDCCSPAITDGVPFCGGECLKGGTKCEFYSTCWRCCLGSMYVKDKYIQVCRGLKDLP